MPTTMVPSLTTYRCASSASYRRIGCNQQRVCHYQQHSSEDSTINSHDLFLIVVAFITALPGIIAAVRADKSARAAVHAVADIAAVHDTINGGVTLQEAVKVATSEVLEEHGMIPPVSDP